jgi:hypothetical protein
MAVLTNIDDAFSVRRLTIVALGLFATAILALIVDYARMLALRRKMVSWTSLTYIKLTGLKATWSITVANRWQYISVAKEQALDLFRRDLEEAQRTSHHILDRQKSHGMDQ